MAPHLLPDESILALDGRFRAAEFGSLGDAWTAEAFHAKVDKQGPCLVLCKTEGGAVCGGYAPKGFAGYGEYRGSIAAFLFTCAAAAASRRVLPPPLARQCSSAASALAKHE